MTLVQRKQRTRAGGTRDLGSRLRAAWWRHPEVSLLVIAAMAWMGLAISHYANHSQAAGSGDFTLVAWTAMVLAMMLPGVVPMVRYVAFNSLWSRRHRAVALFTVAYVGVWVAFGVAGQLMIVTANRLSGADLSSGTALMAAGVVAVAWQFTSTKFRALRRCHLRMPLAARGRAADLSALRYGVFHAWACVGSCWVLMFAMLLTHDFHLMVPFAAVTLFERYQTRPKPLPGAAAIVASVLITVV